MRVVLGTDTLVATFIFPGGPAERVYRSVLSDHIVLVTSPALLAEFGQILSGQFHWGDAHVSAAIAHIVRVGSVVRPPRHPGVEDASGDDPVLRTAITGGANLVVSRDKDLLRSARLQGVQTIDAATLLPELPTQFSTAASPLPAVRLSVAE